MFTLSPWRNFGASLLFCGVAAVSSSAQTFTNLATFVRTNGAYPYGILVQGLDGNLYGTTYAGGRNICSNGCGLVFRITPSGVLTTVHEFVGTDGANPESGLVLGTNGNFYGTTTGVDAPDCPDSSIYEITPEGTLTTLYSVCDLDHGPRIIAPLMQDTVDGNFYGTTFAGGTNLNKCGYIACGSVFKITPGGTLTTLHSFCNLKNCTDGALPTAGLVQASDRVLYGTTSGCSDEDGGSLYLGFCADAGGGAGTAFSIGTGGAENLLNEFGPTDNAYFPIGGIILGNDGNFYGTTKEGGYPADGGTIFEMTPQGTITILHSFSSAIDGSVPLGGLLLATDGNFYGTTSGIGYKGACRGNNCGSIFQITPEGTLTTLHIFDQTDGMNPTAALVQGTDGKIYGTTNGFVGNHLYGTVFQLSMGLAPFVKTVPAGAYTHTKVIILGTNLTGATSVTFNGKTAVFTVVSPTEIQATVPGNATTGTVQVVTPGGTLLSNVPFQVL